MTTIVLADKSNLVRYGLRKLLDVHSDFRIVGEAATPWETVQRVAHLQPHVLVIDWLLTRRGSMEIMRRIRQRSPSIQVILFSLDWDQSQSLDADDLRDLELIYCESIGPELIRLLREGQASQPYLIALTPANSLGRISNPSNFARAM